MTTPHIPVLLDECLDALNIGAPDVRRVVDGTLGAGGHTSAMLQRAENLTVLGLDLDPHALSIAGERLAPFGERAQLRHASYTDLAGQAALLGWSTVDGILLDLGVSSMQVDEAQRGFAFRQDGVLDMRFDPSDNARITAADLVNYADEAELADLFFRYGEERHARKIARAIVQDRPFSTTRQLAEMIARVTPKSKERIHPATRVFQALRIAVNDELATIERVLPSALDALRPGGRLAVISFHSLEDRIVKHFFKDAATEIISPPGMQLEEKRATATLITRKPIEASDAEVAANPRSRSAKLRVVEKV